MQIFSEHCAQGHLIQNALNADKSIKCDKLFQTYGEATLLDCQLFTDCSTNFCAADFQEKGQKLFTRESERHAPVHVSNGHFLQETL